MKVCAEHLAELEQWAIDQVGETIPWCGTCYPASDVSRPAEPEKPCPDCFEVHNGECL